MFLTLSAAAATSAMQKAPIGLGFLGFSHSHAEGKLEVVRSSPDFRIIGMCESDRKIQDAIRKQDIALLSRDALLKHPDIQVIAVESPVRDHAPDGLAVIQAGKHLHLEKAPSDKMDPFRKLVDTAQSKNLLVQVGYMWRYNPGVVKALVAAKQGWLGDIYMVKANIGNQLAPQRRPEWAEFSGGVMFELGGHVIDPVVRLMGKPKRIVPMLHKDAAFDDKLMDNTVAMLEWDKALGVISSSTLQISSGKHRAIEMHGTRGCAIVNPIEQPALTIELESAAGPYTKGVQKVELPKYRRYVDDFVNLAAAIRGEKKLPVTFREELAVEETLLKCGGMA
jgi:predicted dehydrogenase